MKNLSKSLFITLISISLILGACTPSSSVKKSDQTPTKTVGGTVTLEPLFYTDGADGPSGGSSEMTIELRETKSKNITVAISNDEVKGSGDQWIASAWNAMTVSTLITGASLDKRQFQVSTTGFIDGPSAGALMTVGAISLIRGDKIDSDVTMTGTINPDGTVGPVGGIEYKLSGAKKSGKSKVLIPSGQLKEADENGDIVNLKKLGSDMGLEVIEVTNIYEAYKEFTGKILPKFKGLSKIKLNKPQSNHLKEVVNKYDDKITKLQTSFSIPANEQILSTNGFDNILASIQTSKDKAQDYIKENKYASALSYIRDSYGQASTVDWGLKVINALNEGGNSVGLKVVDDLDALVNSKFDDFNDQLSNISVKTLNDAELLIDSYSILTVVKSFEYSGNSTLSKVLDSNDDPIVTQNEYGYALGNAAANFAIGIAGLEIQKDVIKGIDESNDLNIDKKLNVASVAKFFKQGADSNLEAFKTIIIQEIMDSAKVDEDGAFDILAKVDPSVEIIFNSHEVEQNAAEVFGNGDNLAYAQLGSAVELFARSSELMAKYYSLGAPDLVDGEIQINQFRSIKAYQKTAQLAKEQLAGVYTVLSRLGYNSYTIVDENELGNIENTDDPGSAIRGLRHYWKGYVLGRVYSYLGGFPTKGL